MNVLDLNGIGDEKERKRLHLLVERSIRGKAFWKLIPVAGLAIAVSVTLFELGWIPVSPGHRWSRHVAMFFVFLPLMVLGQRWINRDRRQAMIELQKCELRCTSCGYALKGAPGNTCPECGAARPFPMTGRTATDDRSNHGDKSH